MNTNQTDKATTRPCEHIPLDGFRSSMANFPKRYYWCKDCRLWISQNDQKTHRQAQVAVNEYDALNAVAEANESQITHHLGTSRKAQDQWFKTWCGKPEANQALLKSLEARANLEAIRSGK